MLKVIIIIILSASLYSCTTHYDATFTKYNEGLYYRIVKEGDDETLQHGEIAKLYMKQLYEDSVLLNNTDSIPLYQVHDTTVISHDAYTLFSKVTKGDSIIFKALTDSIFKDKLLAWAKHNTWLFTHVYIRDVFPPGYNYTEDMKKEMRRRNIPVPGDENRR